MEGWNLQTCFGSPHCRHENGFAELKRNFYLFEGRRIQPVFLL
ncbi:hypothetical protein BDE40_2357 [Litoreibacter halocynthiae]|uniref:Uncharacterized protein n=1 Tax=Litoreibacter halocynthiae TaxID=1242689 RepID=A0A4R7LJD0_9RHOB|nr:hypothetical protein BDE40_2357 [Litoreibacter halocynthiae]